MADEGSAGHSRKTDKIRTLEVDLRWMKKEDVAALRSLFRKIVFVYYLKPKLRDNKKKMETRRKTTDILNKILFFFFSRHTPNETKRNERPRQRCYFFLLSSTLVEVGKYFLWSLVCGVV